MRTLLMNYLKIFLRPLLIVFLLFAGGCVSRDNIAAIESTSKIEKSNDISVVSKPEQNNTEDSTPVISLPVIPPALEIEEMNEGIVETW